MARKKAHTPEEIVAKLRQAEVLIGQGKVVADVVRAIGVTEPTDYRWRGEFGGWKLDQVKADRLALPDAGLLDHLAVCEPPRRP